MIAVLLSDKKHNSVVKKLSMRARKLNIFLVFNTQSFVVSNSKFDKLFYCENSRQIKALTRCN